jgi:hypothetical protein
MNKHITALIGAAMAVTTLTGAAYAQESGRGDGMRRGGDPAAQGVESPRRSGRGEGVRGGGRADVRSGGRAGAFDERVDRRQARQTGRIRDGRHSGELTRRELERLRQDQRRISRLERRFEADGRYTRGERRTLERALDRSSQRISRAKNNDRTRNAGAHRGGDRRDRRVDHHRGWGKWYHRSSHETHNPVEQNTVYLPSGSMSRGVDLDIGGMRVTWNETTQF